MIAKLFLVAGEAGAATAPVVEAFKTGMTEISASLSSMITGLLPSIVGIMALTIAVYFGIHFIKKTVK